MLGIRLQVLDAAAAAALLTRLGRVQLGLVAPAEVHGIGGSCQLFFIRVSIVARIYFCIHEQPKEKKRLGKPYCIPNWVTAHARNTFCPMLHIVLTSDSSSLAFACAFCARSAI